MTRIAATQPGTGLTNNDITGVKNGQKWQRIALVWPAESARCGKNLSIPMQSFVVSPYLIFSAWSVGCERVWPALRSRGRCRLERPFVSCPLMHFCCRCLYFSASIPCIT